MDYHSYRDSDIDDYLKCCDRLTQLGYYVIRVGVITKKPIKTNNDMIIDYSHSKFRSDFMDFFLGSNCEFCISTGSGFDSIPFVFRKPILYVNIAPVGLLNASSKKFMFLPKHHYCNIKKRNLNLKEIFQNNAGMALKTNDFKDNNISLKNNNPDEILNASLDMINLIKNDFIISEAQIRNVNKFSYILNKYIPKDKYINIHGKIKSSFSFSFLDTNNTYLD
jgi:putative glycosyltransferase (TIGR04372 family)